jgi:hypothetical protein
MAKKKRLLVFMSSIASEIYRVCLVTRLPLFFFFFLKKNNNLFIYFLFYKKMRGVLEVKFSALDVFGYFVPN